MSDASPEDLRRLAVELAHDAGAVLLAARADGRGLEALRGAADRKSSATDLATAADRASEELIASRLAALRPHDALVAEEGGSHDGTSGLTWYVDPLDGTTNFVYDFAGWAVSIAVYDEEGGLAAAVHDPLRNETFSAARGAGAWLDDRPLAPVAPAPLAQALLGTGFSYAAETRAHQARLLPVVLPAVRDLRRGGSAALDLCGVACGRLDAFYEAGLKPWDSAAGLIVAGACGAAHATLEDLVPERPTLVVAHRALLDELVELLQRAAARD